MPVQIRGNTQIKENSIYKENLNTTEPGHSVITKIVAGEGINLESTGVDEGTGDVKISVTVSGGGTPGGNDMEVQYNNAGIFEGMNGWTWNSLTKTLVIRRPDPGPASFQGISDAESFGIKLDGGSGSSGTNGGWLTLAGGRGVGDNSIGGFVEIIAGEGGDGTVGVGGGGCSINGGNGGSFANDWEGHGGSIYIRGGNAQSGNNEGGDVEIWPGEGIGSGSNGSVYIGDRDVSYIRIGLDGTLSFVGDAHIDSDLAPNGYVLLSDGAGGSSFEQNLPIYDISSNKLLLGFEESPMEGDNTVHLLSDGISGGNFTWVFSDVTTDSAFDTAIRGGGTLFSPTHVTNGMILKKWRSRGYYDDVGGLSDTVAEIQIVADGDWSFENTPTRFEIYTTPQFSSTPTLALTVGSDASITNNFLSASEILITDENKTIVSASISTYPSLTELSYVKGVTSSVQSQLDNKVDGPASATDNAIARYDGTTGKLIQDSSVIIDDTGNVGIGTTSPAVKLNVQGGTDVGLIGGGFIVIGDPLGVNIGIDNNEIMARNNGNVSNLYIQHEGGYTILNYGGGNVGIGTMSPSQKLEVSGNILQQNANTLMTKNSDGTAEWWMLPRSTDNIMYTNFGSVGWNIRSNSSTTTMFIQDDGKVGIYRTNPTARLEVYEPSPLGSTAGNSQIISKFAGNPGSNYYMHNEWLYRYNNGSDWVTARLHDAISVDASFLIPGTDTKTWWERDPYNNIQSWGNGAITYVTINGGNVGINETLPDYKLDVNGTFGFTPGSSVTPVNNGDVVFEFTNDTTLTVRAKGSDGIVRSGTIILV